VQASVLQDEDFSPGLYNSFEGKATSSPGTQVIYGPIIPFKHLLFKDRKYFKTHQAGKLFFLEGGEWLVNIN
jgi:hypothetical protein